MPISTNGTVIARLAGGLYNTVLSNATYLEVATQDPSTLANTLYSRDFAKSTDLSVATTLLANLGLSAEAGLDAWVAAQLTAAGAANKGAKIVSLLNDFAGLTADAKWGTYATSFNTKVDAALAASQKVAAVTGVFATAGSVAVANATFTLTTGVDSGAAFTGGAGNDTFTANNAALGTLDSIDGGAGTDSLTITDSVDIPLMNITAKSIETLSVTSSLGSVGAVASNQAIAARESITFDASALTFTSAGTLVLGVGGVTKTIQLPSTTGNYVIADALATLIESALDDALGAATYVTHTAVTGTLTVTAATAGVALPPVTLTAGTCGTITYSTTTPWSTTTQANQVAAAAIASSTFSVPADVTTATIAAATTANIASVSTAATTVTGNDVAVSGGASQTITGKGSVYASGSTGPIVITNKAVNTTSTAGIYVAATTSGTGTGVVGGFGTSSSITQAGDLVTGGSTVSITQTAGTVSSGSLSSTSQYAKPIQVGSSANVSSIGSTTGTETIRNKAMSPTGDVTVATAAKYTNTSGYTDTKFGIGSVKVYTNGGSTVNVTGSNAVTITDLGTTKLVPSSNVAAVAGTSKLTTVNLSGLSGGTTHTITSDAISTVSLTDTRTAETIAIAGSDTVSSNTGTLSFNVSNVGVSGTVVTLSAPNVTTVNIGSAAATTNSYTNGTASNASSKSWIALTTPKATTVNMTNSLSVDIGTVGGTGAGVAKIATVNGSAATGGITAIIDATTEYGMAFTGGSAADTVYLAGDLSAHTTTAKTTTVALGAGNDKLLAGTSPILTYTGATFDGGEGNDTVGMSLITLGNAPKFTNFETLGLDIATNSSTRDASIIGGITGLALLTTPTTSTHTSTYTGVTTSQGLTIATDMGTKAGTTVIGFGSAVTAATAVSDAYTITFAGAGAATSTLASPTDFKASVIKIAGIENVTLASGGTNNTKNTISLEDADARTLTITGNQQTSVTFTTGFGTGSATATDGIGVTSIDASALTGKLTLNTANVGTGYAGITVKGGSGDDLITLAAQSSTVGGSALTGRYVVDAGAGDDTITTSTTASTLTGGAGKDYFDVTLTIAGASASSTVDGTMTTITDFAAGDTIKMGTATTVAIKSVGAAAVVSATSPAGAVAAAISGNSTSGKVVWFQYGAFTYVVNDVDGNGLSTNDVIVKLTGLIDLGAASTNTGLIGSA